MISCQQKTGIAGRGWRYVLIAAFVTVMSLGAPFHEHDLNPLQFDPDCAPCHLSHTSVSLADGTPDLDIPFQLTRWVAQALSLWVAGAPLTTLSRAPPVLR